MCSSRDNQFELESQLHEQYAINNNANVGSFVSFTVALLALFGFFGYSYVYSSNEFSANGKLISNGIMTLDVFLLFSIIVVGMLFFLSLISLQLGYSSRSNQIIIDRIRTKNFGTKNKKIIFGKSYSPKGKTWKSYIQDYFNMFYWLFFSGQILLILFSLFKTIQNFNFNYSINWWWLVFVIIIFLIQLLSVYFSIYLRSYYFVKYCLTFSIKVVEKMIKESCCIVRCIYKRKFSKNH